MYIHVHMYDVYRTYTCIYIHMYVYIFLQVHELNFPFPFYGHILRRVAVTTGGTYIHCIHMYTYLHVYTYTTQILCMYS